MSEYDRFQEPDRDPAWGKDHDLRSDIWSEVLTAARYHPVDDTAEMQFAREEAKASEIADRIIELVREALLSDAAVEAGCERAIGYGMDAYYVSTSDKIQVREAITAALDAAGMGGDGHE